jgi:hypothetical protein
MSAIEPPSGAAPWEELASEWDQPATEAGEAPAERWLPPPAEPWSATIEFVPLPSRRGPRIAAGLAILVAVTALAAFVALSLAPSVPRSAAGGHRTRPAPVRTRTVNANNLPDFRAAARRAVADLTRSGSAPASAPAAPASGPASPAAAAKPSATHAPTVTPTPAAGSGSGPPGPPSVPAASSPGVAAPSAPNPAPATAPAAHGSPTSSAVRSGGAGLGSSSASGGGAPGGAGQ